MESKDIVTNGALGCENMDAKVLEYQYQEIEDILNLISEKVNLKETSLQLIVFYLINHRHKYSRVASYINENAINDEQIISFLISNIKKIKNYCELESSNINSVVRLVVKVLELSDDYSKKFNNDVLIENLEKLQDHINLEQQRIVFSQKKEKSLFSGLLNSINNANDKAMEQIEMKTQGFKSDIQEAKQQINNSVISILGIFCAVVMVFFGGLNVLGNVLATMNDSSSIRVVFMASLVGVTVFNIIFMLLYFIAKVLDKSIATNDLSKLLYKCYVWNEEENRTIEDSKAIKKYRKVLGTPVLRLKYRYPLVYWFNIFMVFIMSSCTFMWGLRKLGV